MQVMLLAAGRSTRLGELGAELPKPAVPICGHPAIAYALALCRDAGLTDIVVNLHHHAELLRAVVEELAGDLDVRFSREGELMGTGGGLAHARALFRSEPVLVLNAKVVADVDLRWVIAQHAQARAGGVVATMVLRAPAWPGAATPIEVDAAGAVVGLRGVRARAPVGPTRQRMFLGIHVLEPELLDRLPARGESDVVTAAYLPALAAGARVAGVEMTGYFQEHSTPRQYLDGNLALLREPGLLRIAPGRLTGIDVGARIDPGATLLPPVRVCAGARIEAGACVGPEVVVGAGVTVAAGARIERTVVWPGAITPGTLQDAVVTPRGVWPVERVDGAARG